MAIFHLSVKSGSRGAGQSACAHGAYIAREGKYAARAAREGELHVAHGNLPAFAANDAQAFWHAADQHERANGRLWTELEISLPRELSAAEQIELVEAFRDRALGTRHPYSLAIHNPRTLDNAADNPHVHLMLSERVIDERTQQLPAEVFFKRNGATKDRGWNDQAKVQQLRELWEEMANQALERAGQDARIDRRSLKDQGIARPAEPKLGHAAQEMRAALRGGQHQTGDRVRSVLQVRQLRALDQERGAVVIELAKVRQEREAQRQRLRQYRSMTVPELRVHVARLRPPPAKPGQQAWEGVLATFAPVQQALQQLEGSGNALRTVQYAIERLAADLTRIDQDAADYRAAHPVKSRLLGSIGQDKELARLARERKALELGLDAHQAKRIAAESDHAQAQTHWKKTWTDGALQRRAREQYLRAEGLWDEARQVLAQRMNGQREAQQLVSQLRLAHGAGRRIERNDLPWAVQSMLQRMDGFKAQPKAMRQYLARLENVLERRPSLREVVSRGLAPQLRVLERGRGMSR